MCGIVGYVGEKQALEVVVDGLRRLEYRGYDSAGVAVVSEGHLDSRKKAGKLANLETLLGFEEVAYMALFGWLAVAGPGAVSLDALLQRAFSRSPASAPVRV